ncbi:AI-2E family transporter [Mycolicibacterium sp.]|uniref:AI-2E family transporter n=1 Tax=Mycolicibacterium sp. TaxID=2320850 RepID=UPI0028AE3A5C|nr:AI-2E family transporter [Mycolicibacterium sp.]
MAAGGLGEDDAAVNPIVRKAAAWAWRLLVILAAIMALIWLIVRLKVIVVPVALAVILTALLQPAVDWLDRRGAPRGGAVALVLLIVLSLFGAVMTFVVSQFVSGLPGLTEQVTRNIDNATQWLISGPLNLSREQIDRFGDTAVSTLRDNQDMLTSGALSTAATLTEILTGAVLMLFALIFLLYSGRSIFGFLSGIVPAHSRERVRAAGRAGFASLIAFIRATFLVALVDAVGIGTGLAVMAIPLALPLAALVFLSAFIPVVGAVISGFVAVIVALLTKGFFYALLTLVLVIAVQQLESNVLQPLLMGRAVSIHPLAIVLAIATGGVLAGIVGALLAVPVLAVLNSAIRVLAAPEPDAEEARLQAGGDAVLVDAQPDTVPPDDSRSDV